MQDTDWITVVTQLEEQLLTAIVTLRELRADIEYRRSTRPAPEQLVMTSEPLPITPPKRTTSPAPRAHRAWSPQETERVIYLWLRNVPLADIADELGRSPRGIETYISDLRVDGIRLPKRDRKGNNKS